MHAVLTVLVLLFILCPRAGGLKIASHNIRLFGESKLKNQIAMNLTKQIVRQYDIVLIQEVMSAGVPRGLQQWIGREDYTVCNTKHVFKPQNAAHKEMYLFLARASLVSCSTRELEDFAPSLAAKFRRPPTIAFFTTRKEGRKFFILGIHTQPHVGLTEVEINALSLVYEQVIILYHLEEGLVMGDFNYAPPYVTAAQVDNLSVDKAPFKRLIGHKFNTTVKGVAYSNETNKSYDRLYVVPSDRFPDSVVRGFGVDRFRTTLSNEAWYFLAESDHYPIYVELAFGGSAGEQPNDFPITEHMLDLAYKVECEAIIKDSAVEDKNDIDNLYLDLLELCTH